ncbi:MULTISPECIES: helix-turn-helix transcriptional regulator [Brevibacillus]|uniref:Transcriptional regulator n=1 Tax=Brevibacillus parabrevis TaxID=54914 RepID=A0A4Y3PGC1_BREPA|nr:MULTISPECIES: helix-turn-helix transcriptional regulator [Brevibacillus]MBU8712463.1 helix-turn-helix transcriptional regulator [Brevibacillus parabrevis]MDH6349538.1 putative transcriptional regulator [Brevibacillus sp. 1238]MDR5002435.1 helix-turn-helix transcriptional regulator [Brevibacillus parabrevis]MED1724503.1 helix-turn-helix transcriptional regulator [Brevibacillus parabrevis]MED2257195.1 helix-turn-helix transcriptional regulator [Brevibacillus parabrevis]
MKNRVRERRLEQGWSQDALSEKVGVSRQTIISLENGKYNASLILAHKLAQVFGCIIEELFIFEGDENI